MLIRAVGKQSMSENITNLYYSQFPVTLFRSLQTADVVIEAQNPQYGDMPYTLQPSTKCGHPGERIHFTPNYVATIGQKKNDEDFGNPGILF